VIWIFWDWLWTAYKMSRPQANHDAIRGIKENSQKMRAGQKPCRMKTRTIIWPLGRRRRSSSVLKERMCVSVLNQTFASSVGACLLGRMERNETVRKCVFQRRSWRTDTKLSETGLQIAVSLFLADLHVYHLLMPIVFSPIRFSSCNVTLFESVGKLPVSTGFPCH